MADLTDTMVCWNLGGEVALVPWPASCGEDRPYLYTDGACWFHVQESPLAKRKLYALEIFMKLTVAYKCDPQVVHKALLGLKEYRAAIPSDMLPEEND